MSKSTVAIQTMILCLLPLFVKGFNSSLSFDPILPGGKVNQVAAHPEELYRIKTVVIDAGHGGKDPGCSGGHSREKHIALAVSLKLAESIRTAFPDIKVILTRDTDVFIPLHERAAIANRANADLFISIHCNYMPGSSATRGTETYVMGLHTADHNLNVAKRENAAILLEEDYEKNYDYDPNSPEGHIMLSMFQNAYLEQSILLAEKFEAQIAKTGRRSRGVKQAGFVVLKETTMPSILAEIGFLSSPKEESFLKTEEGQWETVSALAMAFAEYKQIIETGVYSLGGYNEAVVSIPLDSKPAETPSKPAGGPLIPIDNPVRQAPAPPTAATDPVRKPAAQPASTDFNRIPIHVPTEPNKQVVIRSPYEKGTEVTPSNVVQPVSNPQPASTAGEPRIVKKSVPPPPAAKYTTVDQSDLLFCVQLAASPKPLNTDHSRWSEVTYRIEVVREDDYYKYQARNFRTIDDAEKAKSHLQHQGFIDAFLVIYRDGERLSPAEAKVIAAQLGVEK
jgi:N-acetylmuramoyl-L-alanine amidase